LEWITSKTNTGQLFVVSRNPNAETWLALKNVFPEAEAWEWINENLNEGEKVATIENRIYYVKNCSNDYFFYLDGWEARHLYNISQLSGILEYLNSENVKYVLDVDWAREHGHFDILPMAQFLEPHSFLKSVTMATLESIVFGQLKFQV